MLSGNSDAIWLTKRDVEIKFDIIIPTPKGVLYAIYYQRDTEIAVPTVTAPNQETPTVAPNCNMPLGPQIISNDSVQSLRVLGSLPEKNVSEESSRHVRTH
jgi:hypothetical protein